MDRIGPSALGAVLFWNCTSMNPKLPDSFGPRQLDLLAAEIGIATQAGKAALRIMLENAILLDGKQQDYGSKNISEFGAYGCIVRMSDKFERVKHLYKNRKRRTVNESIRDSFRDFANYAVIAYMCEMKEWPLE